ncbi:hypothetical protein BGX21_003753 [Mortierella sp. AD011]|nr:hypothetical protein BGX20_003629 [Mortierella sp. AD010]KAF9375570.1 hypothetical protein BGX21_003753 [Mortierella sp. AD011]
MQEANVTLARDKPPVFLCSTYEQAEAAMELFTEYYKTLKGTPGPVGFDTETTTSFVPRKGKGVSLVQIATQDVCLMFQVFRITKNNTSPDLFPPRLKAFLEDPEQIKAGVASFGDASALKKSYGIECAGIVSLESMAREKEIIARSLASLDAMFGRPGREVVKTKAMLVWNWDKEDLDPKWVWYAAKDAFAGVAIYENMVNNVLKKSYMPYEEQYPMEEREVADDIFEFLTQRMGGKGKRSTLGDVEKFITKEYPRFLKMYHPVERIGPSRKYVKMLLEGGRMRLIGGKKPNSFLADSDIIELPGRSLSSMLTTSEGIDIISPYFNGKKLDPSTLSVKGISPFDKEFVAADQDLADMKLFLELSWVWDQPKRKSALYGIYWSSRLNAEKRKILQAAIDKETEEKGQENAIEKEIEEKGQENSIDAERSLDRRLLPKATLDRHEASQYWEPFMERLIQHGVVRERRGNIEMNPSIEEQCLERVPIPPHSPELYPSRKWIRQDNSDDTSSPVESVPAVSSEEANISSTSLEIPPKDVESEPLPETPTSMVKEQVSTPSSEIPSSGAEPVSLTDVPNPVVVKEVNSSFGSCEPTKPSETTQSDPIKTEKEGS